jgi:hypothetical protein
VGVSATATLQPTVGTLHPLDALEVMDERVRRGAFQLPDVVQDLAVLPNAIRLHEHRLNQAGYPTATYRQRLPASVYGVFVESVPSRHEAQVLVATLREQGFPEAVVIGSRDPYAVRAGEPAPLRVAVQLAERLREKGHIVRVSAEAGEASQFMIRHGGFREREEAERKSRDLVQLGLPNQVVRVK